MGFFSSQVMFVLFCVFMFFDEFFALGLFCEETRLIFMSFLLIGCNFLMDLIGVFVFLCWGS